MCNMLSQYTHPKCREKKTPAQSEAYNLAQRLYDYEYKKNLLRYPFFLLCYTIPESIEQRTMPFPEKKLAVKSYSMHTERAPPIPPFPSPQPRPSYACSACHHICPPTLTQQDRGGVRPPYPIT